MLWLYWRRTRLPVLVTGIAVGAIAALVVVAGALGGVGARPLASRVTAGSSDRRPGAEAVAGTAQARQRGLLLMNAAVTACQAVSYHGVQMVAWSGAAGSATYLVDVWHRPGQPELAEDGDGDGAQDSRQAGTAVSRGDVAVGVLSIAPWMLRLLRVNYRIEYTGTSTSSGRPAAVVAMLRRDGSLAAQYWLDQRTGLPLRRELFDSSGSRVSEGAFIDLEIGDSDDGRTPRALAEAWNAQPARVEAASLRQRGWTVPGTLAGNMALVGITRAGARQGAVIDASYSDGLSVISVFMQRGELPPSLPGWRAARLAGEPVYLTPPNALGERGIAWSASGLVYTVIADAPAATVTQIVGQLPHDRDSDLWQRVDRGLVRMGSWLNPFG